MNSMNQLLALLPESGWQRLLCDALWQSALISAIGLAIARLLLRQAAARAWVLLLTVSACVIVPLASAASRSAGWTVLARVEPTTWNEGGELSIGQDRLVVSEVDGVGSVLPENAPPLLSSAAEECSRPLEAGTSRSIAAEVVVTPTTSRVGGFRIFTIVWLLISVSLAARLLFSLLAVRRILKRANPCNDIEILTAAAEAARRIGLPQLPTVLVSDKIESPMVLALGKPRLLVPQCSPLAPREDAREKVVESVTESTNGAQIGVSRSDTSTSSDINWTAAFTHELAHVTRRDGWSRLWMELIVIALPLQPLMWLVRRSFHLACEEACDDWSVSAGSDPVDLAETLTAWLGSRTPRPATAIGMSSTKARVLRLLAMHEKPRARISRAWPWISIPVATLIICGLAMAQVPTEKQANPTPRPTAGKKDPEELGNENIPTEASRISLPPYVIEPPDIVLIDVISAVPKEPTRIIPLDNVRIEVDGTIPGHDIAGTFQVDSTGEVALGPKYGAVNIKGLTRRQAQAAVDKHLCDTLTDPVVSLTIDESRITKGIGGEHLVAPDGTVNLGSYGLVYLAGMTISKAKDAIEKRLSEHFDSPKISVDVFAYNSKVYYVIVESKKYGSSIQRFPCTGNETVLDAIANVGGLGRLSSKNIWIARPGAKGDDKILTVEWDQIVAGGGTNTNYQILPGDRIFSAAKAEESGEAAEKIRVELLDSDDPNIWQWRLFIPRGNRYGWKIAYDDIPRNNPPPEGTSHIHSVYSNEDYYLTDNEVLVTAKLSRLENGDWRLSVNSKINSGTGEPRPQMSGGSVEIPAKSLKWMGRVPSTDGQTLGDHGNLTIEAKDAIILLQRRAGELQEDGTYLPAESTAPGFMIWMEKWGEKSGDPPQKEKALPVPAAPPKSSYVPPSNSSNPPSATPSYSWGNIPLADRRPLLAYQSSMPNAFPRDWALSNQIHLPSDQALPKILQPQPQSAPAFTPANTFVPANSSTSQKPSSILNNYSVIIKDVPGRKNSVMRYPCPPGDHTILDALAQVESVEAVLKTAKVWILRPPKDGSGDDQTLDINWDDIHTGRDMSTFHKILPGDRVFITGGMLFPPEVDYQVPPHREEKRQR